MAHQEPDPARRMLDLLYLIQVTEQLGAETLPAEFVAGYNQALDDIIEAIKCEFDLVDLEWLGEE